MSKQTKKTKPAFDWPKIRVEYSTKQFTVAELSRRHGCSRTAIQKRVKKEDWQQDYSEEVRLLANAKLVTEDAGVAHEVARKVAGCNTENEPTYEDQRSEIELAAETRVAVLRDHRKDISALRKLEMALVIKLTGDPKKTHCYGHIGKIITKQIDIPVTEQCQAINNLTAAVNKRVAMERIAFNLNDAGDKDDDLPVVTVHDPGAIEADD